MSRLMKDFKEGVDYAFGPTPIKTIITRTKQRNDKMSKAAGLSFVCEKCNLKKHINKKGNKYCTSCEGDKNNG